MELHLETERLLLRPWDDADADSYREMVGERGDGLPTLEDVRGRMAQQRETTAATGLALLVVVRRSDGSFIGYCGLIIGRSTVEEPEIAYELLQRFHGHGYATEAARAVLAAAAVSGLQRLWSTVRSWNASSLRVLEKLDFIRDHATIDDKGEIVWLTRTLP